MGITPLFRYLDFSFPNLFQGEEKGESDIAPHVTRRKYTTSGSGAFGCRQVRGPNRLLPTRHLPHLTPIAGFALPYREDIRRFVVSSVPYYFILLPSFLPTFFVLSIP